ncbi:polyphosphate polymerase domain-containing protein [Mollicutes bacterium LVI A0039]|nr:polyphosphate polymerase domain-containing protein [Mollicutes bacterium LVI A0039]
MAIEVFNRFEFKYQIPVALSRKLIEEFNHRLILDEHCQKHGSYRIVNRYIDTQHHNLIRKSISKPVYKQKLRIRTYNEEIADDELIFFEIKKKFQGIVNKRRCQMTYREAKQLMENKQLDTVNNYTNRQILSELTHIISQDDYQEMTTIIYDRIAFFDQSKDLRISFDFNIHSNNRQLLNSNLVLMEIKTVGGMPIWLVELLNTYDIRKQSFSKYGTDFLKTLEEQHNERITY